MNEPDFRPVVDHFDRSSALASNTYDMGKYNSQNIQDKFL